MPNTDIKEEKKVIKKLEDMTLEESKKFIRELYSRSLDEKWYLIRDKAITYDEDGYEINWGIGKCMRLCPFCRYVMDIIGSYLEWDYNGSSGQSTDGTCLKYCPIDRSICGSKYSLMDRLDRIRNEEDEETVKIKDEIIYDIIELMESYRDDIPLKVFMIDTVEEIRTESKYRVSAKTKGDALYKYEKGKATSRGTPDISQKRLSIKINLSDENEQTYKE